MITVISFDRHILNKFQLEGDHVCWSVSLRGVQTNVSDSFSWPEFLRSAGKVLHDWIPVFIRIFYSVISKGFCCL